MALFGMELKRRKKRAAGLLSTHEVGLSGKDLKRHRRQTSARSLGRFAGSWAALSLGLFTCYTALHYAPAIVSMNKVLGTSGPKTQSMAMKGEDKNVLSPYLELLEVDRTYLRPGQSIRAEYKVKPGTRVELSVVKCQSAIVVEVFRCKPVASRDVTVADASGAMDFRFAESGFYHFYDKARGEGDADYRVVWSRS